MNINNRIKVISNHLESNECGSIYHKLAVPPSEEKRFDSLSNDYKYETIIVKIDKERKYGLIQLNRAKMMNSISDQLSIELLHACKSMDQDNSVQSIVITGNDRAFCCGADLKELANVDFNKVSSYPSMIDRICMLSSVEKPLIAAVGGLALGGGCEIALICDIVIAAEKARFGQPEIKIGTIPGAGGTQRLIRAVGKSKAMELVLTGRSMSAREAKEYGLVSIITKSQDEAVEEAIKIATEIGALSLPIVKIAKKAVDQSYEGTLNEGLNSERQLFHQTFLYPDRKEGMDAFTNKRLMDSTSSFKQELLSPSETSIRLINNIDETKPPRVISFISFLAVCFFLVSGGPYGAEQAVSAGPPVYVLLAFLVLPFFWAYPLGMITAELSNAVGEDGGASIWAERAFGPEISMLVGFCGWSANIVDLSLYPLLFVQYLSNSFVGTRFSDNDWAGNLEQCLGCRWTLAFMIIIIVVLINIWGAEEVGIVMLMGIGHVQWKTVFEGEGGMSGFKSLQIGTLITTMMWSYTGYDAAGQLAGEVKNPSRNYPLGIMCVLFISIVTYCFPLLVGMSYYQDWPNWQDGDFSKVALLVGGQWLNILMSIGGMASNMGLFNANLCTVSRNIYSLSKRGHLPKFFSSLTPKRGTPWVAICFNSIIVALLSVLPFSSILTLDMSLYSIVVIFECASYTKLFVYHPDMNRPFRAVKSKIALIPLVGFPIAMAILLLATQTWDTIWKTMIVVGLYIIIAVVRYMIRVRRLKKKGPELYLDDDDDIVKERLLTYNNYGDISVSTNQPHHHHSGSYNNGYSYGVN
ncbi:enoyl-CoA hydratase [Heterostelium album PN500]|uniref:Enoyl-CoA hydratase n=1 Tax=Heterostelium pallidum (strain ATCC 26659 / Pp 5 / PN500) TaxID=670386 RepID=D3BGF1_HETP5|nr:enoyl-CoA hydratase [Heterostelium album PN500]EFA79551.1 enoyl-CoA hydratase [Heterostelium album PN500]|eukprot:XP_020431672.1 enoyl-CoA hydratase [Heterostelium album PN500]